MNCSVCENRIDNHRAHLGFTECTDCSEVEKYSAHVVYPHKTGAFVQPVSKTASKNLKKIDRRSTGSTRTAKGIYVDNSWDRYLKSLENPPPEKKKFVPKKVSYNHRSYELVAWTCIDYYLNNGYEPALDFVKELYKTDKITMMTKTRIVNDITNLQVLPTRVRKKVLKK